MLLLFFLFNSGGYFLFFKFKQYGIRQEIRKEIKQHLKNGVPEGQLTTIAFSPGEKIDWVKQDKEFLYKGDLFDVVTKKTINGTVYFLCINDIQEKALFTTLDELVRKEQEARNEKQKLQYLKIIGILEGPLPGYPQDTGIKQAKCCPGIYISPIPVIPDIPPEALTI